MSEMEIMDYEFGVIYSNGEIIFFGHKNINKYIYLECLLIKSVARINFGW